MEKEGYVSLWAGNFESESEFSEYTELFYTDDGDCEPSQFMRDFNIDIDDVDEDFMEIVYLEKNTQSVIKLFSQCSYEDIVIPQCEKLISKLDSGEFNAGILLYDFKYNESVNYVSNKDYKLNFVISVKYKN